MPKEVTVQQMEYRELESLVKEHYGFDYEFPYTEEMSNDTAATYNGINGEIDDYYQRKVDSGNLVFAGRYFLNRLCKDGYIPAGNYVVEVSW